MRKFSIVLICCLICCMFVAFVACGDNATTNGAVFLSNYEEGDILPMYPEYEFNYSLSLDGTEYIFHITRIAAMLSQIKSIEENDTISGSFYPYIVTFEIEGYTDSVLSGREYAVYLVINSSKSDFYFKVNADGHFNAKETRATYNELWKAGFSSIVEWR